MRAALQAFDRRGSTISSNRWRYFVTVQGREVELADGEISLGRSQSANVSVKDSSVSRNHASIMARDGRLTVRDLNSSNGTFLNGMRIFAEAELHDGDRLTLGESEMAVRIQAPESVAATMRIDPRALLAGEELRMQAQEEAKAALLAADRPSPQRPAPPPAPPRPAMVPAPAASTLPAGGGDRSMHDTGPTPLPPVAAALASAPSRSAAPAPVPPPAAAAPPVAAAPIPAARPPAPPPLPTRPVAPPPLAVPVSSVAPVAHDAPALAAPTAPPPRFAPPVFEPSPAAPATPLAQALRAVPDGPAPTPLAAPGARAEASELLPSLPDLDPLPPARPAPAASAAPAGDALGLPDLDLPPLPPVEAAPPRASAARPIVARPAPVALQLEPAGFWIRLVAVVLDSLWIAVICVGLWFATGNVLDEEARLRLVSVVWFVLDLGNRLLGWSLWGTTPGKRLLGLYVCPVGSSVPGTGFGKGILRCLGYWVNSATLGVGFLMAAFTQGKRGLHDMIAGTYVGRRKAG